MELPKAPTQRLTHSPVAKDDNSLHDSKQKKAAKKKTKTKTKTKKQNWDSLTSITKKPFTYTDFLKLPF